ncbi:hypothetical protein GPECTOR_8g266 [Gonium pectorale]|uniref:Uncharacterized protein n=1 Tax=Gonium pectorale TaxID=33097 RepID=A0A150GSQ6_GONPE|nr:hypothetical protein GPECTOR_8g266 [Gonium pectorale]|eukprot:KXZ52886.1 hypothetical protein GPECTOR_8g266 [Gonium pectorale]
MEGGTHKVQRLHMVRWLIEASNVGLLAVTARAPSGSGVCGRVSGCCWAVVLEVVATAALSHPILVQVHFCKLLFLCVALYDLSGRVCKEGQLDAMSSLEAATAGAPGLEEGYRWLQGLCAMVVVVVQMPGIQHQEPDVTMGWPVKTRLPVGDTGLYVFGGWYLVYWGRGRVGACMEHLCMLALPK